MCYNEFMAKRNTKRRRKKNSVLRLILIFVVTLSLVLAAGLSLLFLKQKSSLNEAPGDNTSYDESEVTKEEQPEEKVMFSEAIPEDEIRKEEPEEEMTEEEEEEVPEESPGRYDSALSDEDYMRANNIYAMDGANSEFVRLSFAGDILFDPSYAVTARLNENGGEISAGISQDLLDEMRASDIMMLNNEFPYSSGGEPLPEKTYTFRAKPESVRYLSDMGVDIVSIANNHAFDYGERAFLDTLSTLENAGMPYVGGGRNIEEASRPVYYIINDIKIGFLSATQIERLDNPDTRGATDNSAGVFRCLDNHRLLSKITETKENCDFLVVYIHWGTESTDEIDWLQRDQAPQMVDAGADLIIGDHPHVLQPITYIKGVPVIYSLGNFWFNSFELDTGMVQAEIDETGLRNLKFVPCKQSGCKTRMLEGAEAQNLINYMQSISPTVHFDAEGYITN